MMCNMSGGCGGDDFTLSIEDADAFSVYFFKKKNSNKFLKGTYNFGDAADCYHLLHRITYFTYLCKYHDVRYHILNVDNISAIMHIMFFLDSKRSDKYIDLKIFSNFYELNKIRENLQVEKFNTNLIYTINYMNISCSNLVHRYLKFKSILNSMTRHLFKYLVSTEGFFTQVPNSAH
ncbi:hypothetical protein AGLY_012677 [Aphis glycines]|uniref:Uncharacterized protein n=1 Tax=Aphis glycines TaxID=307491 RepID=A0A6G0T8B2_APHGL|nr:hypothetical protein AGLY_012677 [Aphis glycines]